MADMVFCVADMVVADVVCGRYRRFPYSILYGLEVCPLNKANIQSLDFCVNRLLMKLFCTNNFSVIEECRHNFIIALPSELLCMRAEKFVLKLNANCG